MFFDAHVHSEGLGVTELRKMNESGIKKVCSLSFYPIRPLFPQTLIDAFRKLEEFEKRRCEILGITMFAGVGIHPRCIPPNYATVIDYLEANDWDLFGEIGLEKATDEEIQVFKDQLKVAKSKDVPCIVHTPRGNKRIVTKKILEVLESISFPAELAVVDHVNFENLDLVLEKDYWVGLTVQMGKLSVQEVAKIVEEHGSERFIVNSDAGYGNEFVTAVAEVAKVVGKEAEVVCLKNAEKFLGV